jgi:hypothetical protein
VSAQPVVVEGTLKPDGTLELDERPKLPPGRVQVIVQPLPELPADDPFWQRMKAIWADQKARGHVPRSAEQVEAERREFRREWEERARRVEHRQGPPPEQGG